MNIHICSRFLLILAVLVFGGYSPCQAASDEVHRTLVVTSNLKGAPARLIIRRIPNLGKFLTAAVWIDGVPIKPIQYGASYEGFLSPGRHTLSALAVPDPTSSVRWQTTIDFRSGRTYAFTALADSGHLILKPY
jgi:hypothetical protein